jgi:protein O-GlcNAc transferase
MATVLEALAIAIQHYQAGRLQEAEQIYRQILAVEPNHADVWHLLGVIAHQMGRHDRTEASLRPFPIHAPLFRLYRRAASRP